MAEALPILAAPPERLSVDALVIGSGPGGSLSACMLAEAGRDVLIVEEGSYFRPEACAPFSREEMQQKYRNGGLTVALGATKVNYVEGRCVGGGSEINSGLHHRTPADVLAEWARDWQVAQFDEKVLQPHFEAIEDELHVCRLPEPAPAASLRLQQGADRLGWQALEVPRWYRYGPEGGVKQSMTRTYLARAVAAGARLLPETRVLKLRLQGARWQAVAEHAGSRRRFTIEADSVFVAGGAVQTPLLLRRSGLAPRAGSTLHLHPTVKVTAEFADPVNHAGMGVPVHQVKEFSPRLSFGGSISSPPYLALALLDHPNYFDIVRERWQHLAIYYAMTRGGVGSVRPLPFFRDGLVRYRLSEADRRDLADGLRKLCKCLFAAGATVLYPSLAGVPRLNDPGDLDRLPAVLPKGASLMTVHLFSSCPMGESAAAVTDSFGAVRGVPRMWVADASLLPGPPGVNPQGTILAIVRRNLFHHLGRQGG